MGSIVKVARKFRFVVVVTLLLLGGMANSGAQAQTLYTVEPNDDQLRVLDPNTAETLDSITISVAGETVNGATGLATHPSTNVLYAILKLSGVSGRVLATINPTTGVATMIGNTGDSFASIAFDCNGVLYGVTGEEGSPPESLFTIDTTTAAPTFMLGLGAGDDGEAIGFNPTDGFMYHG
jgi:hypothetical protein